MNSLGLLLQRHIAKSVKKSYSTVREDALGILRSTKEQSRNTRNWSKTQIAGGNLARIGVTLRAHM